MNKYKQILTGYSYAKRCLVGTKYSCLQYILLLVFGLSLSPLCFSQKQQKVDSLLTVLKSTKADTTRLRVYSRLCDACEIKDNLKYADTLIHFADSLLSLLPNEETRKVILEQKADAFSCIIGYYQNIEGESSPKALGYHEKMLAIYTDINDKKGIASAMYNIGFDYNRQGNIMKQMEYYQEAIKLLEKLNYKKGELPLLTQQANNYVIYGDTVEAMKRMQMSLSVARELNDTNAIANGFVNMGTLYLRDFTKEGEALSCFRQAIALFGEKKNEKGIDLVYFDMSQMYMYHKDYDTSLYYLQKYLPIVIGHNNYMAARALKSVGMLYRLQGIYDKAIEYYTEALKTIKDGNYNIEKGRTLSELTLAYQGMKQYKKAKQYADKCLATMEKSGDMASICSAERELSVLDSDLGDYKNAYANYQQYTSFRDKLKMAEVRKTIEREEYQNEYQKKQAAEKAEQEKKDAIAIEEKRRQHIITWSVVGGLFFVLIFFIFVLRGYLQKQKDNRLLENKNKIIEEKNRDITSSITYAKRIQQARLPKHEDIISSIPESFILFKPKDIVSGDFYFFHKNNNFIFIAAADCTGHGVPGAFMSIIGSEKLSLAVAQSNDTSAILKYLNQELKMSLHQSDGNDSTRDGMDIALCVIDMDKRTVQYAGANRPFWLIHKDATEIEETKATKRAIGGFTDDMQHFDSHEIKLQKGDSFYIFSDGYADTFGGQGGKKLTTKKFKQILLSIQNKTLKEQEQHLDDFIENWKAGLEQVDDILVIGVRV